ncbi:MAG: tetratricopeptide repeat protein [Bacteroidia bacterium]|nr:tetratricopeptide repeat protein [Bacteroidia bacterium]
MIDALNRLGDYYYNNGEFSPAMDCFQVAAQSSENRKYKYGLAQANSGMGLVYLSQSNHPKALEFHLKALRINEEIKNIEGILVNLGNIGIVYVEEKNYPKAIEYYQKVMHKADSLGKSRLKMVQYANLGTVYAEQSGSAKTDLEKGALLQSAEEYYKEALQIAGTLNDKNTRAVVLLNIAAILSERYNITKSPEERNVLKKAALQDFDTMLILCRELGNKYYEAVALGNLGAFYMHSGEYVKAEYYLDTALEMSTGLQAPGIQRDHEFYFYTLYDTTRRYAEAMEHYKKYIVLRDSIMNQENSRKNLQQQMQYDFEKKEVIVREENKRKIQDLKMNETRLTLVIYAAAGGLLSLIIISILIFRNLKVSRLQNNIIRAKNKDILDSITCAKRIQEAILPSTREIQTLLPEHFIYYAPKDIVAGDFYWQEKLNQNLFIAAADCTGHGVPGALVSVICSNALTKALMEEKIEDTGKLLSRTREIVVEKLSKNNDAVMDGMDISLVSLRFITPGKKEEACAELEWAGANLPLWIIRAASRNHPDPPLQEFKPTKQAICKTENPVPFSTVKQLLYKGDTIYLFTDGFQDQFGGEKGKKFKKSHLKEYLLSIQKHRMDEQRNLIHERFTSWKGTLEQVDDVCVIGVRV